MRPGEEIFTEIVSLRDAQGITLSEAIVGYAERADTDVEDILKALDATAIRIIRESLQDSVMLKPSMRKAKRTSEISFD